ncbi:hypothetical protein EVAR_79800_1 [Eumeta japonica]|uniref:Uncharacterized protein n=1 Tax=Eumeta variegata TaxID=151549 RepID=A0A4C1WQ13_EUMVA|nr:hypothetical protein EVAR_79800_1 [Eumeta japonica]
MDTHATTHYDIASVDTILFFLNSLNDTQKQRRVPRWTATGLPRPPSSAGVLRLRNDINQAVHSVQWYHVSLKLNCIGRMSRVRHLKRQDTTTFAMSVEAERLRLVFHSTSHLVLWHESHAATFDSSDMSDTDSEAEASAPSAVRARAPQASSPDRQCRKGPEKRASRLTD